MPVEPRKGEKIRKCIPKHRYVVVDFNLSSHDLQIEIPLIRKRGSTRVGV